MCASSAWTGASPHINKSELMCKRKCGFYGNPAWHGYCSKCFKEQFNKKQKRPVFDPTNIKNRVSRSVSDVTELPSKATSLVSRKLDKQQLHLGKRTKIVKDIFRISHSPKAEAAPLPQFSPESQAVYDQLQSLLKTFCEDANSSVSKRIKLFIEKISKIGSNTLVDDLGEVFHEFYSSLEGFLQSNSYAWKLQEEDIFTLVDLTEKYVTSRLYNILTTNVHAFCEEKDLSLQERIKSLMWITCEHLECKIDESDSENRSLFDEIINVLIEVDSRRTPSGKLSFLVNASNQILALLKKSCSGALASADDFLPALIYCILKANPPLLQSNICYITNFAQEPSLQTGEAGYFFTNLCCAISFIEKLTADSLGLSDFEFNHFMSGNALPANAFDESYMPDAFRIMERNLENVTILEKRMDSVLESYNKTAADLEEFQTDVTCEIQRALDRTPLTIRPRNADIDEPLPALGFLPAPLTPQQINEQWASRCFWSPAQIPQFSADDLCGNDDNPWALLSSEVFSRSPVMLADHSTYGSGPSSFECPVLAPPSLGRKKDKSKSLEGLLNEVSPIDLAPPVTLINCKMSSFKLQGETIPSIPCSTGLTSETQDDSLSVQKSLPDSYTPLHNPPLDPFAPLYPSSDPFSSILETSSDPFSPINLASCPFSESAASNNLPPPLLPLKSSPQNIIPSSNNETDNSTGDTS